VAGENILESEENETAINIEGVKAGESVIHRKYCVMAIERSGAAGYEGESREPAKAASAKKAKSVLSERREETQATAGVGMVMVNVSLRWRENNGAHGSGEQITW